MRELGLSNILSGEETTYMRDMAINRFESIMQVLKSMPRPMLLVFRNINTVRSINITLGAPVDRYCVMAKRYAASLLTLWRSLCRTQWQWIIFWTQIIFWHFPEFSGEMLKGNYARFLPYNWMVKWLVVGDSALWCLVARFTTVAHFPFNWRSHSERSQADSIVSVFEVWSFCRTSRNPG